MPDAREPAGARRTPGGRGHWARTVGRVALFPFVLGVGVMIGLFAILLRPRSVVHRLRERRTAVFETFSAEERKTIRHILIGLGCAAALAVLAILAVGLWRWIVRD